MDKFDAVVRDMHDSMRFVEKAKPIVLNLLKGEEIIQVEGTDNEVLKMLDQTCGIDYYNKHEETGLVWGIASRFQPIASGCTPWNTFTVRRTRESGVPTEYTKRKYAIEHGGEYPYLTLQAYVDEKDETVVSMAIARTKDIIESIDRRLAYVRRTRSDNHGQASFYVIDWDKLREYGYKVLVYERTT